MATEQDDMTPKAAQAYHEYAMMGPSRSLRKLAESNQKYSKSIALLMRWSDEYHWAAKAREYDEEQRRVFREEHEAAVKEMRQRQVRQALEQMELSHKVIMERLNAPKVSLYAAGQIYSSAASQERALLDGEDKDQIINELRELAKEKGIIK